MGQGQGKGMKTLVGLVGFEPTTPALSTRCSNQLSYRPATDPPLRGTDGAVQRPDYWTADYVTM